MNKIKNRGNLHKLSPQLYSYMKNNNIDLLNRFLPRIRQKWTLDLCKNAALKYKSIKKWRINSPTSYLAAHRNGWWLNCTKHMTIKTRIWTKNLILKNALKYKTIKAWRLAPNTSYHAALKRQGLLKLAAAHLKKPKKWTNKEIFKTALKYNTIQDWRKNHGGCYASAKRKKIFKYAIKHMQSGNQLNQNKRARSVVRNDGKIFKSIRDAKRQGFTGVPQVLSGKHKTAGGYRWAYCDENGKILKNK